MHQRTSQGERAQEVAQTLEHPSVYMRAWGARAIGCRNADERTCKLLASLLLLMTYQGDVQEAMKTQTKNEVKCDLKKLVRGMEPPRVWLDKLPVDPLELRRTNEAMFCEVYKDGGPVLCACDFQALVLMNNSFKCRGSSNTLAAKADQLVPFGGCGSQAASQLPTQQMGGFSSMIMQGFQMLMQQQQAQHKEWLQQLERSRERDSSQAWQRQPGASSSHDDLRIKLCGGASRRGVDAAADDGPALPPSLRDRALHDARAQGADVRDGFGTPPAEEPAVQEHAVGPGMLALQNGTLDAPAPEQTAGGVAAPKLLDELKKTQRQRGAENAGKAAATGGRQSNMHLLTLLDGRAAQRADAARKRKQAEVDDAGENGSDAEKEASENGPPETALDLEAKRKKKKKKKNIKKRELEKLPTEVAPSGAALKPPAAVKPPKAGKPPTAAVKPPKKETPPADKGGIDCERLKKIVVSQSLTRLEITAETRSRPRLCVLSMKLSEKMSEKRVTRFVGKIHELVKAGCCKKDVLDKRREWVATL